jgi:RimJ/RimL family protein N-acetyltransferase
MGRHVRLRNIELADVEFLYRLHTVPEVGYRLRLRGATPKPEAFVESFWEGVLVQFMIEARQTREPIGVISAYSTNMRDGWTYMAQASQPRFIGSGWSIEALALFVDYLFALWNFRKLYSEAVAYNFDQFASGAGRYFELEGCLRNHQYYAGRFWDMHILSITRQSWEQLRPEMLRHLADPATVEGSPESRTAGSPVSRDVP